MKKMADAMDKVIIIRFHCNNLSRHFEIGLYVVLENEEVPDYFFFLINKQPDKVIRCNSRRRMYGWKAG